MEFANHEEKLKHIGLMCCSKNGKLKNGLKKIQTK